MNFPTNGTILLVPVLGVNTNVKIQNEMNLMGYNVCKPYKANANCHSNFSDFVSYEMKTIDNISQAVVEWNTDREGRPPIAVSLFKPEIRKAWLTHYIDIISSTRKVHIKICVYLYCRNHKIYNRIEFLQLSAS